MGAFFGTTGELREQRARADEGRDRVARETATSESMAAERIQAAAAEFVARATELGLPESVPGGWGVGGFTVTAASPPHVHWGGNPLDGPGVGSIYAAPDWVADDAISTMGRILAGY